MMRATRTMLVRILLSAALVALLSSLPACTAVRFNQKQRLAEVSMQFDPDPLRSALTGKVLTSREGAVGGFFGAGAGGCGCN